MTVYEFLGRQMMNKGCCNISDLLIIDVCDIMEKYAEERIDDLNAKNGNIEIIEFRKPRQSGKTTFAVAEFLRSPDKSLLVVRNAEQKDQLVKKWPILGQYKNVTSLNQLHCICSKQLDTVIIDEYYSMDLTTRAEVKRNIFPAMNKNGKLILIGT